MTPEELSQYKKIYFDIKVNDSVVSEKWDLLTELLPEQKNSFKYYHALKYVAVFVIFAVILLAGTARISQASKPGDILYPVKILTDKVTDTVNNTFSISSQTVTPQESHDTKNLQKEGSSDKSGSEEENKNDDKNEQNNPKNEDVEGVTSEDKENNNSQDNNKTQGNSEDNRQDEEAKNNSNGNSQNSNKPEDPGNQSQNSKQNSDKSNNASNGNGKNNGKGKNSD